MIDDGGFAFPRQLDRNDNGDIVGCLEHGMTLRDWFAGQALAGLRAADRAMSFEQAANDAYVQADAMIRARRQKADGG